MTKREYIKKYPWARFIYYISTRCNSRSNRYYKKGIKNFLKVKDLKYLWFRDKAYLFGNPSIHRRNHLKDYTLQNCCFVELIKNLQEGGLSIKDKRKLKTKCKNGHLYTGDNTSYTKQGWRVCKTCKKIYNSKCYKNKVSS